MSTVKGVLQKYHEGQNIFRREAVSCLVACIEQLEKYIASQHRVRADAGDSTDEEDEINPWLLSHEEADRWLSQRG